MKYEIVIENVKQDFVKNLDDYFERYFANDRDDTSRAVTNTGRIYVFNHKSDMGRVDALFGRSGDVYSGKISLNIDDVIAKEFISDVLKDQPSLKGKIVQLG